VFVCSAKIFPPIIPSSSLPLSHPHDPPPTTKYLSPPSPYLLSLFSSHLGLDLTVSICLQAGVLGGAASGSSSRGPARFPDGRSSPSAGLVRRGTELPWHGAKAVRPPARRPGRLEVGGARGAEARPAGGRCGSSGWHGFCSSLRTAFLMFLV
jgi:hypothetical protein